MPHAAFFRNLNQGQRASPSSSQLIEALEKAGADDVRLVGGNGTAVFTADAPEETLEAVVATLAANSPWSDIAFARTLDWLASVSQGEFDGKTELTLFDPTAAPSDLPIAGRRCTVIDGGPGWAITTNELDRESNATPTLERVLGIRATSRALPTIRRLLR